MHVPSCDNSDVGESEMNLTSNELFKAVRLALYAGATAAVGLSAGTVFAQDAAQDQSSQKLETITVTGSNIRRVDIETANPVVTIDRAQIARTGKLTVGDLIQELPSISGAATNPNVNNGGGTGASTVSLRGLGSARTLLLLNGRRLSYSDVNSIPANLIERIEILKDGASAIYGSDAIGGVVNFITRKEYQGLEVSADYGISDKDDGARRGATVTLGQTSDHGSIIVGLNYNKTDAVFAKNRKFSATPLYNYFGNVYVLGSGTIPQGRYVIPRTSAVSFGLNCPGTATNVSVTRINGAPGTSATDFRCYVGGGPGNDTYNYQAAGNVELTPQERGSLFVSGSYKIADNVEAYVEAVSTKTRARQSIAPLPLIFGSDSGVILSADSIYNPFGVTVRSGGLRMSPVGNRETANSTQADQLTGGLRGSFGDTWQWDAGVIWARIVQRSATSGHFFNQALGLATGPSFIDADGVPTCGTPAAPIAGCTPINLFGLDASTAAGQAQLAALRKLAVVTHYTDYTSDKTAYINANGELFQLPAGALQLAVGADYVKNYNNFEPDFVALIRDPATGGCLTDADSCASPSNGKLSRKEVYAEVFVPILKDIFLIKSLYVTLGSRYSDYSAFGNTTNSKLSVEWRPIEDLLVRGTASQVFRSPTITDLFGGVTPSADTYNDPCAGAGLNLNNPACAGLAPGFEQTTAQTRALYGANARTQPETGKVMTWGVVYDPQWLTGVSVGVDFWRVTLHDTIGTLGTQTIIDQCYKFGRFCNLFTRELSGLGDVDFVNNTIQNIGRLDTDGVDLSFKYRLPEFSFGRFGVSLDTTYTKGYSRQIVAGDVTTEYHYGGAYQSSSTGGDGNFSRIRALASLNWSLGAFDASWRTRFVSGFRVGQICATAPDSFNVICPPTDTTPPTFNSFHIGGYAMHSLAVGYNLDPVNTRFELGVDNVFDKQPPLLYQYGFNGATDERTFDVVGRFYWGRVSVKF